MQKEDVNPRAMLLKHDKWLFALLLALALAVYLFNTPRRQGEPFGQITANGTVVYTIDLSKDGEFTLEQNQNLRFAIRNGAAAFIESDCPDKICVNSGFLSQPGQMAVCMPNRITLAIIGADSGDHLDAVAN